MAVIDEKAYGGLLAHALPRVVETDEENERLIAELERLDSLPRKTPEEESLAASFLAGGPGDGGPRGGGRGPRP